MDDLCDTHDTLAAGVSEQLYDGRVHPYSAPSGGDCAGGRLFSEAITLSNIRLVLLTLQADDSSSEDRRKEMKKVFLLMILMVFGLALLSGCASMTGETAGQNIDDSTIHTKATAIVVKDPDAHYFKIDVSVTQGDIVLTGFVNSRETEERIIGKIREIKGVKSVKSLLKVEVNK